MRHTLLAALAAFILLAQPALAVERYDQATRESRRATEQWLEILRATGLWSGPDDLAQCFAIIDEGSRVLFVSPWTKPEVDRRLQVWNPATSNFAWIDRSDVRPVDGPAEGLRVPAPSPPQRYIWEGVARVTMYSCVELGGCNATASGIWPYEGVVAVDPRVIPLGSLVWIDGLGIFLAADTGSLVYGNRLDVFVHDHWRAINWGVQYLNAAAFLPE